MASIRLDSALDVSEAQLAKCGLAAALCVLVQYLGAGAWADLAQEMVAM